MTNQNDTTPAPKGQESPNHKAFAKAFVAKHYYEAISSEPFIAAIDPAERWEVFLDLWQAHDVNAAALCLGDLILTLPTVKRESLLDLIAWAIKGNGDVIW